MINGDIVSNKYNNDIQREHSKKLNKKRCRKSEEHSSQSKGRSDTKMFKKKKNFSKSLSYPKQKILFDSKESENRKNEENNLKLEDYDLEFEKEGIKLNNMFQNLSLSRKRKKTSNNSESFLTSTNKNVGTNNSKCESANNKSIDFTQILLLSSSLFNDRTYKFVGRKKIDLILDLDQTLIFSKENTKNEKDDPENSVYNISIDLSSNKKKNYQVQFRKGFKEFMEQILQISNIYINTHASKKYANQIITLIKNKYNYDICIDNVTSSNTTNLNLKTINENIKNDNFLIVDDSIISWEDIYFDNIIPSMKFQGFFYKNQNNVIIEKIYHYYFYTRKLYEYDEFKRDCIDKKKIPYAAETDVSGKSQLHYIGDLINKSYLLSLIKKIPINFAMKYIKQNVLKNCYIFLCFTDDFCFFKEMVFTLGGAVTFDCQIATHFIYWKEKNISFPKERKQSFSEVNLKWLFHCYFYFSKMDEKKEEYISNNLRKNFSNSYIYYK